MLRLLVVLILVLFSSTLLDAQEDDTPKVIEYTVTADSANLRTGAGTNFAVAGQVKKGDTLLIYDEESEVDGWLKIYREDEDDAFIADFLVEKAPVRFYPIEQEPVVTASGRGKDITDVFDLPEGIYRIDAVVDDRSFILSSVAVEGDCTDRTIFNELNFDVNRLTMSGLLISQGCSLIFETDNVDSNWVFEIRNLLDEEFLLDNLLTIEDESTITGAGRTLTMGTILDEGVWTISANVDDRAFILHAHVLIGDCDDTSVFNEVDFDAEELEISSVYRNSGDDSCVIYWETSNVEGGWELTFEKLR